MPLPFVEWIVLTGPSFGLETPLRLRYVCPVCVEGPVCFVPVFMCI